MIREAILYEPLPDSRVQCALCAHRCMIKPGRHGICGVRENRDGILYSLVYGALIAQQVDPIEKKPFFHVYPGSRSYSIATVGCNFQCTFCQNAEISQWPKRHQGLVGNDVDPESVVQSALKAGCQTLAYTYTEPTVYLETALDTAKIALTKGLKNIFVTNGYMTPEALDVLAPCLAAANVDLKSFRDEFYKKYCGASLQPVLESLKKMKALGVWVEITTLIIPGLNDSPDELRQIASFIKELGCDTPWHVSRFHPQFQMLDRSATPMAILRKACDIGKEEGLNFVYSGNVPGEDGENTYCPNCGKCVIYRYGYRILDNSLSAGQCPHCGVTLAGLF